jgi:AAA ATPase domain
MDAGDPSHTASGGTPLVGREAERALIAACLDDLQGGAAILVRGQAGIGKSALVDDAARRAGPSRRILRTVGTSPETGLRPRRLCPLARRAASMHPDRRGYTYARI